MYLRSAKTVLSHSFMLASLITLPWEWRLYVIANRRWMAMELHCHKIQQRHSVSSVCVPPYVISNELCAPKAAAEQVKLTQSVIYKTWGCLGGDYEECRLLGYKIKVRTSQETHYCSTTESSQLMLCKIWGFHGSDYEEWRLLGFKNTVRTSQETHYCYTTESSQLMLCKIWGFHGGHYEECRLLGYKNQVRTSQETHYFSTTESSQLMLCKIWGFHGGDY
jgi:hypothetical protein